MARYHINKHGVPAICKAKPGNCPLGGDNMHFDSHEEAQEHINKQEESKYGILPGVNEHSQIEESKKIASRGYIPRDVKGEDLDNLEGKDVRVAGVTIGVIDGPVYGVHQENGKRILRMETVEGVQEVDLDDGVQFINASKLNYYDEEYMDAMRDIKRPLYQFRYSKEGIKDLEGKYVAVKYDGKTIYGKIVDTEYNDEHDTGLTIKTESGEQKHIKSYSMTFMEDLGDNEQEYKLTKQTHKIASDIAKYYIDRGAPEMPDYFDDAVVVDDSIEDYIESVIRNKETGERIATQYADIDWDDELNYTRSIGRDYYEEIAFMEKEIKQVQEYYDDRIESIDDVVYMVEQVDWTKYGVSQKDGEVQALKYINKYSVFRFPEDHIIEDKSF